MAAGRTTDGRSVTVTTTSASTAITAAAGTFVASDATRGITGTGIPAGTTIASVTSDTAAVLSAAATASGSVTAALAARTGLNMGFVGWSPETDTESGAYSVAANNAGTVPPGRITNPYTGVTQRARG